MLDAVVKPCHQRAEHTGDSSAAYKRRSPEQGVLYKFLLEHIETFLAAAAQAHDGVGVPIAKLVSA